jgi:hypothetical protein
MPLRAVAVAAALLSLSACSLLNSDKGDRNAEGEITSSSDVGVFNLEIGDCFAEPVDAETFSSVAATPCGQAHNAEIIKKFTSSAPSAYDEAAIMAEADETCAAEMDSYVGPNWYDEDLVWSYFYPDDDTWTSGKHTVICYAVTYSGDANLTATLKGAAA